MKSVILSRRFFQLNLRRPLYTRGCGVFGALGHGDDFLDTSVFRRVINLDDAKYDIHVRQISAGWGHSSAVTSGGHLVIFGRPYDGHVIKTISRIKGISPALARFYGKFSSGYGSQEEVQYGTPQFVDGIENAESAHCSLGFTVCLSKTGELYSFGQDKWGQCGIGSFSRDYVYGPTKVCAEPVKSVDVGLSHCVAISECGSKVFTWGRGSECQLGIGLTKGNAIPQLLETLKGSYNQPSAGFYHTAVLSDEGVVYVWGKGMASVLKRGGQQSGKQNVRIFEDQVTPREVRILGSRKAVQICSSNFTLVVLCCDGSLWAMGTGEYDRSAVCTPVRVQQSMRESAFESTNNGGDGYFNINTSDPSIARQKREGSRASNGEGNDGGDTVFPYAAFPPGAVMKKGFQRVAILSGTSDGLITHEGEVPEVSGSPTTDTISVYEVIIHGGEAFLKMKNLQIGRGSEGSSVSPRVVEFSTGWQHSMLLLADE